VADVCAQDGEIWVAGTGVGNRPTGVVIVAAPHDKRIRPVEGERGADPSGGGAVFDHVLVEGVLGGRLRNHHADAMVAGDTVTGEGVVADPCQINHLGGGIASNREVAEIDHAAVSVDQSAGYVVSGQRTTVDVQGGGIVLDRLNRSEGAGDSVEVVVVQVDRVGAVVADVAEARSYEGGVGDGGGTLVDLHAEDRVGGEDRAGDRDRSTEVVIQRVPARVIAIKLDWGAGARDRHIALGDHSVGIAIQDLGVGVKRESGMVGSHDAVVGGGHEDIGQRQGCWLGGGAVEVNVLAGGPRHSHVRKLGRAPFVEKPAAVDNR